MKEGDEIALHIHCWCSLVQKVKVTPLEHPRWYRGKRPFVKEKSGKKDYGHGVPLGVYNLKEIKKIINYARQLLQDNGLIKNVEDCVGFRCGGWLASDDVLTALSEIDGMLYDSSGAPAPFFKKLYEAEPQTLYLWLDNMWGAQETSSPKHLANTIIHHCYPGGVLGLLEDSQIITQPLLFRDVNLVQVPDTAALADYTTVNQLKNYINRANQNKSNTVISMGFHDSNAAEKSHLDTDKTNIQVFSQAVEYFLELENTCNSTGSRVANYTAKEAGQQMPPRRKVFG